MIRFSHLCGQSLSKDSILQVVLPGILWCGKTLQNHTLHATVQGHVEPALQLRSIIMQFIIKALLSVDLIPCNTYSFKSPLFIQVRANQVNAV